MKTLLTLCCLLISFTAASEEVYRSPILLTPEEAQISENALINNKVVILNHWKTRLELALQNKAKVSKSGIPLQKPYYGDSGLHH